MRKWSLQSFPIASLALLILSALAYLPHLGKLGYTNDDWYLMYDAYTQGSSFFTHIFASDRPGRAPVMQFFYTLFGPAALGYHLSGYLWRALSGISALWIFRILWPERPRLGFIAALAFTLYPGFLSQTNAIDYQSHLLALFSAMFSIALTLKALQASKISVKITLGLFAALTGWLYLSQMEYFIGLEAFRALAVYLWVRGQAIEGNFWPTARAALQRWLPYAIIPAAFLFWRIFLFSPERRATDVSEQLGAALGSPLQLVWWLVYLAQDMFNVLVTGWVWPLYHLGFQMRLSDTLLAAGLAAIGVALVLALIWRTPEPDQTFTNPLEPLAVAGLALLAGQIPVILANRHIIFPEYSRYTLVGILGAALALTLLITWQQNRTIQMGLVGLIVFTAIFSHYANGALAAERWEVMRQFWWQVSWRAPDLQNGATLVASYPLVSSEEDYFIWGPANLIYRPEKQAGVPIKIQIPAAVLTEETIFRAMQSKGSETQIRRGNEVVRDFGNILVLTQATEGGCVRILDGNIAEGSSSDKQRILLMAATSNIKNVQTNAPVKTPPEVFFGREPTHGWCYYYQKAALARQQGNWQQAASLGNQAFEQGLYPSDSVEMMLFFQAYAITGQQDRLRKVVPILLEEPFLARQACDNTARLIESGLINAEIQAYLNEKLACKK